MQVKIFTIPIIGGEALNEMMNTFLRSKKVLEMEKQLVTKGDQAYWCFCISFLDAEGSDVAATKPKVDYREILDPKSFERYSRLRDLRNNLAKEEKTPPYAVFTNEELASIAKIEELTLQELKKVKGVGEKKVEKYGKFILEALKKDEKSE